MTMTLADSDASRMEVAFPAPSKSNLPDRPSRILVADDEHLVATGIATILKQLRYSVVGPLIDGKQVLEQCALDAPDLALLDIRMPDCCGIDIAQTIFNDYGVPTILFSAFSDQEYVDRCKEGGVFGYLLKPVTSDPLRIGIDMAWSRYRRHLAQSNEISVLRTRLEDRKIIEQAKWIIVSRRNLSEPDAMRSLQQQARNNRKKLVEVARDIVDGGSLPADDQQV